DASPAFARAGSSRRPLRGLLRACGKNHPSLICTLPQRKLGPIVPRHELILAGKLLRLLQKFREVEEWDLAFPTDPSPWAEGPRESEGIFADCMFKPIFFTGSQDEGFSLMLSKTPLMLRSAR